MSGDGATAEADRAAATGDAAATLMSCVRSPAIRVFAATFLLLWAFAIVVLLQVPWIADGGPFPFAHADKVVHVGMYFFATFWASVAVSGRTKLDRGGRGLLLAFVVAFAAVEEIAQTFAYRMTSPADLAADALGAACGIALAAFFADVAFAHAEARRRAIADESEIRASVSDACRRLGPRRPE